MLLAIGRRRERTGSTYCPGMTVFGLGLALMVAPLTATVLAAAPDEHAGHRQRGQQRPGPGRLAARGRRAAGRGRPRRRGLRRPGGLRRRLPDGDDRLRGAARPRRRRVLADHPQHRCSRSRRRQLDRLTGAHARTTECDGISYAGRGVPWWRLGVWGVPCVALVPACGELAGARSRRPSRADAATVRDRHRARAGADRAGRRPRARRRPAGPVQTPLENADMLIVDPDEEINDDLARRVKAVEGRHRGDQARHRPGVDREQDLRRGRGRPGVVPPVHRRQQRHRSRTSGTGSPVVRSPSTQSLKERLPIDDDGYLRLGSGDEDPLVHVGAYAPQIPTVDLVVNAAWGEELGMTGPNALLVSARDSTPQALSKPIKRLIGGAGRAEPRHRQPARPGPGRLPERGARRHLRRRGRHLPLHACSAAAGSPPTRPGCASHITTEVVPILGAVTCNKAIFPQLKAALGEIVTRGPGRRDPPRRVRRLLLPALHRRSTQLSNHAFGLALDLNVPGNQRGTVGQINREVVDDLQDSGASAGAATGATPTRCTSSCARSAPGLRPGVGSIRPCAQSRW